MLSVPVCRSLFEDETPVSEMWADDQTADDKKSGRNLLAGNMRIYLSLSLSLSENESHNWPAYACNSTYIPLHSRAALEQFVIAGWPVRDPVPAVARK